MEFHAVILCGHGHRLSPFSSVRSSGLPKALLPVANRPLLAHVLDWCGEDTFSGITIVAPHDYVNEFKYFLEEVYLKEKRPRNTTVVGTSLEHSGEVVAELIQSRLNPPHNDFIVLPCDFISEVPVSSFIDAYRARDKDVIATGVYYRNAVETIEKKALVTDYLVHTPLTNKCPRLLDSNTRDAVSDHKGMPVRTEMLWKYPNSVISSDILSASAFLCSGTLLDLINNNKVHVTGKSWAKVMRDVARRSWKHSHQEDDDDQPKSLLLQLLPQGSLFIRANTVPAYVEANRHVMRQLARQNAAAPKKQSQPGAAAIGGDSAVGEDSTVGEKSSVKRTVVGSNCTIGRKCRLTGCVVMDNVTLEDDVILENCVVGRKASIGAKARLTSCHVEGGYEVPAGAQIKNETLQNLTMESLMDGAEYDDDDDEDDDDEDVSDDYSDDDDDDNDDGNSQGEWEQSEGEGIDADEEDDLFER